MLQVLKFLTCLCKVSNQRCLCLADGLFSTDVFKCKDLNNSKQDHKNSCDNLVEEEEKENVCHESGYSDDSEWE